MSDHRAEQALRSALAGQEIPPTPDPQIIRRRVRDRRIGMVALASALILLVSAGAFVAADLGREQQQQIVAAPGTARLPADPAPEGWRTEYYRDISFEVPDAWGHTHAPESDWCLASTNGQPEPRHRQPYVSLGRQPVVATVGCPPKPGKPLTEHVLVYELKPNEDVSGEVTKQGAFWIVPRGVSGQLLVVTSTDEALARRIVDSAKVRPAPTPCDPDQQLVADKPARPEPSFDVAAVQAVGSMVICQYESSEEDAQRGLRAVVRLDPDRARAVVDAIAASPIMQPRPCQTPIRRDLALLIRFEADGVVREVYLQAGGCADGTTPYGGFDDGTNVRTLTRAGCKTVLVSPAELWGSGAYVGNACLP